MHWSFLVTKANLKSDMQANTNVDAHKKYLQWLRDAHAMEEQSLKIFEDLDSRIENYPDFRMRVKEYIFATQNQKDKLENSLELNGSSASLLKDVAAKALAFTQSVSGMPLGDEVVKAVLSAYTFIHMKIGSYSILVAAAKMLNDSQTLLMCEQALTDEVAMAQWLKGNMTAISEEYLLRVLNDDDRADR